MDYHNTKVEGEKHCSFVRSAGLEGGLPVFGTVQGNLGAVVIERMYEFPAPALSEVGKPATYSPTETCPGPTRAIVDLGDLALESNIHVSVD